MRGVIKKFTENAHYETTKHRIPNSVHQAISFSKNFLKSPHILSMGSISLGSPDSHPALAP